ncbi:uncharacterized protein LOC124460171 [Drosophila willistoni]|uniref:uncharacterized protein LOC124460171 n=1 Tax=Drosophila willistoni TaxID=7260 RepID=UPI00017D8995|nr:uncharacterized protein LOC124460171 [Drosophila willistoni]
MFNLNQLPGLTDLGPEELMQLKDRMDMLMERVLDGNDYFDPGALAVMETTQAYSLNVDELWVRQVPHIHKIFVVLLVSVQSGKLTLVYAACRCGMPKKRKYISNADDLQGVLLMVLRQVPNHLYRNVVAIVSDRAPVNMQALKSLRRYIKSPTVIYDGTHLMRTLNKKECPDPFATKVLQELLSTLYEKETFRNHLYMIRDSCRSRKYENLALIWDFVSASEDILKNVFAIDGNQFNLSSLINHRLEQYGMVAIRHVPEMSLEESRSVNGIAAFLVYEATKYMDEDE